MKRVVRIIATSPKYRKGPYPAIAVWDGSINTYLTGQHIDPRNPKTKNNLTKDEMTGKVMISPEKLKKFPHIINPETNIPIKHMRKLDISITDGVPDNAKDYAEYVFFANHCPVVAFTKDGVGESHYFYIEDREAEAEIEINRSNKRFEAEKCIRERVNDNNIDDVCLMLNYRIRDFNIDFKSMSYRVKMKDLLDAAEKHSEEVIACFTEDSKIDLFIYKLAYYNVISLKDGAYFDGTKLIGTSVAEVRKYVQNNAVENQRDVQKWGSLLGKTSGGEHAFVPSAPIDIDSLKEKPIEEMSFIEMKKYAGAVKKYKKEDWENLDEESLRTFLIEKKNR